MRSAFVAGRSRYAVAKTLIGSRERARYWAHVFR